MKTLTFITLLTSLTSFAQYAPAAGEPGTTAIHKDSSVIFAWATEVVSFNRGLEDMSIPDGPLASYGDSTDALGYAEGNSADVVSLGDNGSITVTFEYAFHNGEGFDFLVFENSFSDTYLELAHVEVSSDGINFVRVPSRSLTQTDVQTGTFGDTDPTEIYNLAGKYRQGFGTPFDLEDIVDEPGIDLTDVKYVRIIDVIGAIDWAHSTYDSHAHIINDPFKTDFESGGFDLDAVGVINSNDPSVSIPETELNVLVVYPNPTNGSLTIQTKIKLKTVVLTDALGRIVYQGVDTLLDLSQLGLNTGVYLLRVTDVNDSVYQERISFVQ
ncbi:MAG: T9SS type A sorting domain-containing protein [Crocinitomix sp.]|nr:T9SS type A sorting domain-containing protein [Crocinitomix sp.]